MLRRSAPEDKNEGGYTVLELVAVAALFGLLAALAFPLFATHQRRASNATAQHDLHTVAEAVEAHIGDAKFTPNTAILVEPVFGGGFKIGATVVKERLTKGTALGGQIAVDASGDASGYCLSAQHGTGDTIYYRPQSQYTVNNGQPDSGCTKPTAANNANEHTCEGAGNNDGLNQECNKRGKSSN